MGAKKIKIRQQIDLIINVDSMMEMTKKVINEYFLFIQGSLKYDGIFYNVNKYKKIASGDVVKIASTHTMIFESIGLKKLLDQA